jgi:hypothetical protein
MVLTAPVAALVVETVATVASSAIADSFIAAAIAALMVSFGHRSFKFKK